MKTLWITGGNGQLGRAMQKVYQDDPEYELVCTGSEVDITDLEAVLVFARQHELYAIVNCAAMTAVDACEKDEEKAMRVNALGPKNLAKIADLTGAKLVHVSTDYVFAGDGKKPYTEFDTPNPISAYGRSKLAGEEAVKLQCSRYFIVRTAWLYGDGKNFVRTMVRAAATHDTVTVVDDQIGSPTNAMELARSIKALVDTENYGIYHGTCEGVCSWAEFTEEIYRLAGIDTKVIHVSSAQYKEMHPESADRPHYSVLDNTMFRMTGIYRFADWKDAIAQYIENGGI